MTPEPQKQFAYSVSSEQSETLRIVRSIRDRIDLLSNKVVDEIADRFKGMKLVDDQMPLSDLTMPVDPLPSEDGESVGEAPMEAEQPVRGMDTANDELDSISVQMKKQSDRLADLSQSEELAQKSVNDLQMRKAALDVEIRELESSAGSARKELEAMASEKETLSITLEESKSLIEQAELIRRQKQEVESERAKLEDQRAEFEHCRVSAETARLAYDRLWPEWLKTTSLADSRATIEAAVADTSSPPSARLLFAALHTFSAAIHDDDPKTLHDSLRDVGRRLYGWRRDLGESDEESAVLAEKWGKAINGDLAGRGEVEIPIPGHAANNQWMIFQPRGGSSPDVISVRSWCVRDAQKRPVHRAEVTV